jgi:hypothetical protein
MQKFCLKYAVYTLCSLCVLLSAFVTVLPCATPIQRQHVPHFHLLILVYAVSSVVVSVRSLILEVSQQIYVLRGEIVSLTPNPQPRGPGYPFLSGPSPLTCLARDAIPVASRPPA